MKKVEQARQKTQELIAELSEALSQGHSETLTAYLETMSRFHHYSFGNILLIYSQRPSATRVAGFHTWRKLGRHVRKGERGIVILAPMISKRTQTDEEAIDNKSLEAHAEPSERVITSFRAVHVFDYSQTEGKDLPEHAVVTGDPSDYLPRLKDFIADQGISLETAEDLRGADGVSTGGKIVLLGGLPPATAFSVLVHETAHEMMHQSQGREGTTRTTRETEAEAVAYVVCRSVGLDPTTSASDYIQLYQGTPELLAASFHRIQKTADQILGAIQRLGG